MLPKDIHIKISARFDGSVLVTCEEMPGLILAGTQPEKIIAAIWPALQALDEYKLGRECLLFKAGDRVHHIGRKEDGTVLSFDTAGVVRVEFDNPTPRGNKSFGEFDEAWFNAHPGWLRNLTPPGGN